ncbi:MAG: DUF1553 domain-containing protein [Pedosphaera sp.]|nr:DUF1553 domain-containing protein [Pedosphaera sp.]
MIPWRSTFLRMWMLGCAVFLALTWRMLAAGVGTGEVHWAYRPLARPAFPPVRDPNGDTIAQRHPVDGFVAARLAKNGWQLAPRADRRLLIRRLSFDLLGVPPNPGEMDAFVADERPDAWERLVDRYLASPEYGERWARHWMDAVHFAETHGHDQDRIRTNAWPYRDYLVTAFNADVPYGRFIQEQLAGDVLFPEKPEVTAGLGMIASGPWDESSLRDIREDTLDRQIGRYLDRDDMIATVMATVTSTSVQCARCHDHKFDPIPQQDYYALQAVFAGVERADRAYDLDPELHRERQSLLHTKRAIGRKEKELETELLSEVGQAKIATWERQQREVGMAVDWQSLKPDQLSSTDGSVLSLEADRSIVSSGPPPARDTYRVTVPGPLTGITAFRLEVLSDPRLPQRGPGRQMNGNFHLSEFTVTNGNGVRIALDEPTADFNQEGWSIQKALDNDEKTAWGIYPEVGKDHAAIFQLVTPLTLAAGDSAVFHLKQLHGESHLIGRFRLAATTRPRPVRLPQWPNNISKILGTPLTGRSPADRIEFSWWWAERNVTDRLKKLPMPRSVYGAASDFEPNGSQVPALRPRPIHILNRGEITRPGAAADPGALACLASMRSRFDLPPDAEEGVRRAALARWLTASENSLTWRSIVNRVWHHHFGKGLVETVNDFGRAGGTPSHPELLDWLAVWFRDDAGGSFKRLHRLLLTSATWQQSTMVKSEAAGRDSDNRLLWRMNALRLDAEAIRDAVLRISGDLDSRMGGPSDRQFDLKAGIHVTPRVDYSLFSPGVAESQRRSVYRFLFRTLPDPFMSALDCPAGDQLAPIRNNSVTVQQALALWNDALVLHQSVRLAGRLEREQPRSEAAIRHACEWCWGRPPTLDESEALCSYASRHGVAQVARLLFNSNEFVFVN